MKKLFFLLSAILIVSSAQVAKAQKLNIPAASPIEKIVQDFGTSQITIDYSRPSIKDRVIFGGLVPYDEVWRTGANACTKISFGEDVKVEGNNVPAGIYALFTIPGKEMWTFILSKDTSIWGAYDYKPETDLLRFKVKPTGIILPMETFTININNIRNDRCDIQLSWERTMVSFHVTADVDPKVMAQIDESMKWEKPPYYQAAQYYYNNDKDLKKAYEWIKKAVEEKSDAYSRWLLKARIELKLYMKEDAKASANKCLELAKADNDAEFTKLAETFLADFK